MATETVKITLTEDDIKNGKPDDCSSCPIALALKRIFPHRGIPSVDRDSFYFDYENEVYALPSEVSWFIDDFDALLPVEPISFDVEVANG